MWKIETADCRAESLKVLCEDRVMEMIRGSASPRCKEPETMAFALVSAEDVELASVTG
jgi:hypothetical protein